jgi:two-component system cell cycle response regulator
LWPRKEFGLLGKSAKTGNEDVTQEITVPVGARSKRSALALQVVKGPRAGEVLPLEHSHAVLGRGIEADIRIEDPSLSRMHARFDRDGDTLAVTDLESRNGTFVEGQRIHERHRLKSGELITVGSVVMRFAQHDAEELELARTMYEAAVRDRLTGLHNRGYFDDRIAAEYAYVKRHGGLLAVLLIDLDHFKQVNDTHGHAAGDAVIRATAKSLNETLRAEDVAARYGGEEFVVLARGSHVAGAQVLAERLRTRIAQTAIETDGRTLCVTASVGISVLTKELAYRNPAELLAGADEALYASKANGRNRVTLHRAPGVGPERPAERPERVDGSYAVHGGASQPEQVDQVRAKSKRRDA